MGNRICRRQYIKAGGASTLLALAGCIGEGNGNGNGDGGELTIADTFPESHYLRQDGIIPWSEQVTERTDGEVTFEFMPSGQLGEPGDMLDLVQQGATDIGFVGPAYVSDQLPLCGVAELPGTFDSSEEGTEAYWELLNGILYEEEIQSFDVRPVLGNTLTPYQIVTEESIESTDYIEELLVRSGGGTISNAVEAIGATAVEMPAPDIYSSLESGTINSAVSPIPSIAPYDMQELLDYCTTNLHMGSFCVTWMINDDSWEDLSSDVHEAMNTASNEVVAEIGGRIDVSEEDAKDELSPELEFYETPVADDLANDLTDVAQDWADNMDDRGLAGSSVLEEWNSQLG